MDKAEFIRRVREIGPSYRSNDQVVQDLRQIELIALVGPTGAGKTTLSHKLGMPAVKSDVTRVRRKDEKHSDTYIFRDDYDAMFADITAGEYVQFVVSSSDEFYGTRRKSYPTKGACVMSIYAAAMPVFKQLGFGKLTQIYIMPPGYIEWMHRIGSLRSDDITARMEEARQSLKLALRDDSYQFVLNDNLDMAVTDVRNILKGEDLSEHRMVLIQETANMLLERLGDLSDDVYFDNLQ